MIPYPWLPPGDKLPKSLRMNHRQKSIHGIATRGAEIVASCATPFYLWVIKRGWHGNSVRLLT